METPLVGGCASQDDTVKDETMRIIAGRCRGLKLSTLPGLHTRPTADRVKEAVFSSLQADLPGAVMLDLFAGSGSIGLEALSRGAKEVYFIENDQAAYKVIQKNITMTPFAAQCHIVLSDAINALKELSERVIFDMIYIDPPYHSDLYEPVLKMLETQDILADQGIIVLESAKSSSFSINDKVFLQYKTKIYGDACITYLKKAEI